MTFQMQVIVELSTDNPLVASPTWLDISAFCSNIKLARGRDDAFSTVDVQTMSVDITNNDGRFSVQDSASPYFPNLRKNNRLRIRVVSNSVSYTRGVFYVNEWPVKWIGKQAVATVTASDIFKLLARDDESRGNYAEQALDAQPVAFYPMDESEGQKTLGNYSAATTNPVQGSLRFNRAGRVGGMTKLGDQDAAPDSSTGLNFAPGGTSGVHGDSWVTGPIQFFDAGGVLAQGNLPAVLPTNWAFDLWLRMDPLDADSEMDIMCFNNTARVPLQFTLAVNSYSWRQAYAGMAIIIQRTGDGSNATALKFFEPVGAQAVLADGRLHMVTVEWTASTHSLTMYVDGVSLGSTTSFVASPSFTAASASLNNSTASNAIDASTTSIWTTGIAQASGQTFTLDLGSTQSLSQIVLDSGPGNTSDYPANWSLATSNDNITYGAAIATGNGNNRVTNLNFSTTTARYWKVSLTGTSPLAAWWTIANATAVGTSGTVWNNLQFVTLGGRDDQVLGPPTANTSGGLWLYTGRMSNFTVYNMSNGLYNTPLSRYTAGFGWNGDDTGARITRLLTYCDLPSALYNVGTGTQLVGPQELHSKSKLDSARAAAAVEDMPLYVARDGRVTFEPRTVRNSPTFVQIDAKDVPDLTFVDDDAYVVNVVEVTGTAVGTQTIQNLDGGTSIARYGKYKKPIDGLPLYTDEQGVDLARRILARWSDPPARLDQIVIEGVTQGTTIYAQLLQLEVNDGLQVNNLPTQAPSNSSTYQCIIEGVEEDIQVNGFHTFTFKTSPITTADANEINNGDRNVWRLGITGHNLLGTQTIVDY